MTEQQQEAEPRIGQLMLNPKVAEELALLHREISDLYATQALLIRGNGEVVSQLSAARAVVESQAKDLANLTGDEEPEPAAHAGNGDGPEV
jgi:hypothetical protein